MLTPAQRFAGYLALAFFVGLACGQLFHSEPREPAALSGNSAALIRGTTAAPTANAGNAELSPTEEPSRGKAATGEALTDSLRAAVHISNSFQRRHDLYDIAMTLDAEGCARALEAIQSFPKHERDHAQPMLLARWLDFDPAAAFAWANALPPGEQRGDMLREFFYSLGLKNAATAMQYLNTFEAAPNHGSENYASRVFDAWSANDPSAATQAAFGLARRDARSSALYASLKHWTARDPQAALAWTQQLSDSTLRREQRDNVLRGWAENDPQAALTSALTLPEGADRNRALSEVIRGTAQNDMETATQLLAQLPEGPARNSTISNLISQYSYQRPEAFTELVLSLPPSQQRSCAYQIGNGLARQDVSGALAWAAQLGSDEIRASVTNNIVQVWAQTDPRAAAEYSLKNPSPEGQGYGFTSAVMTWAREDSGAALAWARGLTDGKQREAAVTSALSGMAGRDPQQAANLAASDLSGQSQMSAFGQIASTWASTDPGAAMAWAAQLSDANRQSALTAATSTWARNDPRAAAKWLDQLPAGSARDSAVVSFASSVSQDDPEGAVAWAATIGNSNQRDSAVQQAFWNWLRVNKTAAAAWLDQTNSVSDATRATLKRNIR